jgi:hypothetical protein
MYTKSFRVTLTVVALLCGFPAVGQKMAEQFIPIGLSPGLSNEYTYIGPIEAVDSRAHTITAAGHAIKITDDTHIWLDRSSLELSNQTGEFGDLRSGRKVEIKYANHESKDVAEWVKVEITAR